MLSAEEMRLVGGSDAAAVAGVHPRKRPIDVWRRIVEGFDVEQTPAMRRGVLMEPVIRQMFAEESGIQLLGPRNLRSKKYEFVRASLDDVAEVAGEERVVEFKSVNARVAARYGDGGDEVPEEHLCQVQWYLGVSGWSVGYLAALLGGDELRTYTLSADAEFQGMLFEAVERFWKDHVLTKRPPPPDGSGPFSDWLHARYTDKAPIVQADARADGLMAQFRSACEALDAAETLKSELRQKLELIIGDAAGLEGTVGRISYKRSKDGTKTDWKAVADELQPPSEIIQKHTTIKTGPRVFRPTWSKE